LKIKAVAIDYSHRSIKYQDRVSFHKE